MKTDKGALQRFYQRLSLTDQYWEYEGLPFFDFVCPDRYYDLMEETKLSEIQLFTDMSKEELLRKMLFFPHREVSTAGNSEDVLPYTYVKAFKNRKVFIENLFAYIRSKEKQIGVITVNRYSDDDEKIKSSGVFVHDSTIMQTFSPKMFTDDNWIRGWPWPNFGTNFFLSLDHSWALYSTNMDDQSLVVFMADKTFTPGFFSYWPDIVKHLYQKS